MNRKQAAAIASAARSNMALTLGRLPLRAV